MSSLRTQVYLTRDQRKKLDERRRAERKSLAQVIRDAVDAYLADGDRPSEEAALESTFGIDRNFAVPSRSEWKRRGKRLGRH